MNRPVFVLLLAALVAYGTVSAQQPERPRMDFLAGLKKGNSVNVKEVAGRFEFSFFDDGQMVMSHKVIEIGPDFMTIEDISNVTETRIPIYAIKSIVKNKVPK